MYRLKKNQKHSCSYCREQGIKTPAIWRSRGWYETACEDHKAQLDQDETKRETREQRMTEADHQTWGRL
ncbi:MAG: Uncharacterized protein AWU57_569 [Marinobacter sp. T13-3]|nr:MAG: Uncharacterized protein AWU57_569 [Marinobacter sp. T13-3]